MNIFFIPILLPEYQYQNVPPKVAEAMKSKKLCEIINCNGLILIRAYFKETDLSLYFLIQGQENDIL